MNTDPITGKSFAIWGGPVGLVQMSAEAGFFNEDFVDTPAEVHTRQYIGELSISFEEFSSRLNNFASKVNNNYVPYNALDHNSNSLAAASIKMLGFTIPEPAVSAPGWGRGLTFYSNPIEYRVERHGWHR